MRAKRRGTSYVYTEPGPGAFDAPGKTTPVSIETIPVTTPKDVIHNPPSAVTPERVCPHGGLYFHEMPVCGECNSNVENENLFGLAVLHIARKTAHKIRVSSTTFDFNDVLMVSATALVENRKRILLAKNPSAMAVSYTHLTLPTICSV